VLFFSSMRDDAKSDRVKLPSPMNVIALDTSTEFCSVTLLAGEREIVRECRAEQRHSSLVLPMVDEVLREAGLRVRDLHGIGFGAGPGSFTGLRIACGVVQGLAFAAGVPVHGVSCLLALAEGSGAHKVIAALDARLGEIYHAAFVREGDEWRSVIEANLNKPDRAPMVSGTGWHGVGSGFAVHADALRTRYGAALGSSDGAQFPHSRAIAKLAAAAFARGEGVRAHEAAPVYLREKVALTVREQELLR
jgi:tRNA threonylcarbamoyladenosine biosynthesis protein TsaB